MPETAKHPPSAPADRREAGRRRERTVLFVALAVSAAIHFIALDAINFEVDVRRDTVLVPAPAPVRIENEMKVYDLITVEVETVPIDVQLRALDDARELPAAPQIDAPLLRPPAPRATAAEALRGRLEYRMGTAADVWRPPVQRLDLSAEENARGRIAARLQEYNDSMAADAAARAKANDWTVRTADGGRWGVTADSIYMGGIAVKNRVEFQPPPGRRDEIAGRVRTWGEIQQQVTRIEGNDIINDRIKAIRARIDAERARRLAQPPPDTTRAGG